MERSSNGTAYDLTGPEFAPAVVLIHGLGLSRQLWGEYVPALSESYRVLNYDLFGHGESLPSSNDLSLQVFADQLADLMNELELARAAIVGFSIGGMINRRFAIDHPEKVSALAILNSPHDRGSEAQAQVEERALKVASQGALSTMDAALERWFTGGFRAKSEQALQAVKDWRVMADPHSYAQSAWVLAAGVPELTQDKLPIVQPCLILTCENDSGSTPAMSRSIADQLNKAELTIVPKLKHLGLLEDPRKFINILSDFLQNANL